MIFSTPKTKLPVERKVIEATFEIPKITLALNTVKGNTESTLILVKIALNSFI